MYKRIIDNIIKKWHDTLRSRLKVNNRRDFSLNSGERQVAINIDGIRKDHILRYNLVCSFIKDNLLYKNTIGADIFCGNGYGSYLVASTLKNTTLLSIDASEEAIKLAKKYYSFEDKIIYKNKFFPFKLEKNKYDYIISFESIEHIENDIKFIETLILSIKNNGYLFLSTPNEEIMSLKKNPNKFHYRHYTQNEISNIFEKYNLEVIEEYGEDTYIIDDNGLMQGILNESEINLIKGYNGQFKVYILKINKE